MTTDSETKQPASVSTELNQPKPVRFLRLQQVQELVGLKRATIYELDSAGRFPRRVKITGRAVGWVEEEVQQWLVERRNLRNSRR